MPVKEGKTEEGVAGESTGLKKRISKKASTQGELKGGELL